MRTRHLLTIARIQSIALATGQSRSVARSEMSGIR